MVTVYNFLFSKHFRWKSFCTKFGCRMMYIPVSMIFFYIYCAKGNGSMSTVFKIKFIKLHLPERNFIHKRLCTSKPLFQVHSLGVLTRWVNIRSLHFNHYSKIITLGDIPCVSDQLSYVEKDEDIGPSLKGKIFIISYDPA